MRTATKGFTLVEMIAGIVIMAMAMTALTTTLFPQASGSVDPVYQVRAAELGQSLINEIMGKAFDENTNLSAGLRCDEVGGEPCTGVGKDGVESTAGTFDDVDDYNDYDETAAQLDDASLYSALYKNFTFTVTVIYDGDYDGVSDTIRVAKRVEVVVTTPGGQAFKFAAYKGNY
jgi:MSHA pilin protein MshD